MIISFHFSFLEQAAHACLEFWYSLAHNGGVTKLTIKEEVGAHMEELRTQSIIWELEATNKESDSQWQVGQVLVNANNLVVIAEKGEKEGGFVAIDDLFFKIDPEFLDHCETMPPSVSAQSKKQKFSNNFQANPEGTTSPPPNTTPSPSPIPDCNFDTNTCGWEVFQNITELFDEKTLTSKPSDPFSGRLELVD